MLPFWSMAMLPIQRVFESGAKVPCWNTVGDPLGSRSSYQRYPVVMVWLVTKASCPSANLRYASRYIKRSPSISNLLVVPGWATQVRLHPCVKAATDKVVGPTKVELAGTAKSTCSFHNLTEFTPKFRKNPGSPAAG